MSQFATALDIHYSIFSCCFPQGDEPKILLCRAAELENEDEKPSCSFYFLK